MCNRNEFCFHNILPCYHGTTFFWELILLTRQKCYLMSYLKVLYLNPYLKIYLFETFLGWNDFWNEIQACKCQLNYCISIPVYSCYASERVWDVWDVRCRSSHPEVFLGKGILKIYIKFTGDHPCRSAISIKFNKATLLKSHGCSPVNLLQIFRTPFLKNTSGWLFLEMFEMWEVRDVGCLDFWGVGC